LKQYFISLKKFSRGFIFPSGLAAMGHLPNFYRDSDQKEQKNDEGKSQAAPTYNQSIARKSSSKLRVKL